METNADQAAGDDFGRALALYRAGRCEDALAECRRIIAVRPDHLEVRHLLGVVLCWLSFYDEAITILRGVIAQAPAMPGVRLALANALRKLGGLDEAAYHYRRMIAEGANEVEAHCSLAEMRISLGDYAGGFAEYEWRMKLFHGYESVSRALGCPQWTGEDLNGRAILLLCEQGMGDTLQFARYFPLLLAGGAKVVIAVQGALVDLLAASFPQCEVVSHMNMRAIPKVDYWSPILSLANQLGVRFGEIAIPYLQVPPATRGQWRDRLATGPAVRVGLAWSGNESHLNDRNRSVPLRVMAPLLATPGAQFFLLQKGVRDGDKAAMAELVAAGRIVDLDAQLDSFADTAAVCQELDLVICVDTSLAHVAGAIGRPAWMLVPQFPDWRWGLWGETTPWYPSLRLFRQARPLEWEPVVAVMAEALAAFIAAAG
jgi:tetratricopeptide (TPR) repeat protein